MTSEVSPYEAFKAEVETAVSQLFSNHVPNKVSDNKVIRDAVFGFNQFYKHEISLLDSPLIQRLRRVHQTSLAVLTYPSSTHTRFEHSLGVTGMADKMIQSLNNKHPSP